MLAWGEGLAFRGTLALVRGVACVQGTLVLFVGTLSLVLWVRCRLFVGTLSLFVGTLSLFVDTLSLVVRFLVYAFR